MIPNRSLYMLIFILPLILALSPPAMAETDIFEGKATATGLLDVQGQLRDVNGSEEKFEEYRDVPGGFNLNIFDMSLESNTSPYYLDIRVRDASQEDESYRIGLGKHGRYGLRFSYDSIPHNFSKGVFIFGGAGEPDLKIPDEIQSSLETVEQTRQERGGNPLVDTTGEDALAQGIVRGLYEASDDITFRLEREKYGLTFNYDITDTLIAWLKVKDYERRRGTRVITTGTYERFAQGAAGITHVQDLFVVRGAELANPIDYTTTSLAVGAGIHETRWLADIEYTFTDFENENTALRWDNPFRLTDAAAQTPTGTPGNAFDRGRFARGQLALPPDAQAHDFTLSGGLELPAGSRLAASASYGIIVQKESFVPYTLNSAISDIPLPAGPGFDVTDTANLPQRNMDGEVNTKSLALSLSTRPVRPVDVVLRYKIYDYENDSDQVHFPGYAAFGESFWRTVRNDPGAPVENELQGYTKQNADAEVNFRPWSALTVTAQAGWEKWDREHRFVGDADEVSLGASVTYRPIRLASIQAGYKYSHRTTDEYAPGATAENPEARGLEDFDLADRKRDAVNARVNLFPADILDVGVFYQYEQDRYGGDARFGLKKAQGIAGGADLAIHPSPDFSLFLFYTREDYENFMQAAAKDDPFNDPATPIDDPFATDNFNPRNYWNTDIDEVIDTFGLGFTLGLGRMTLAATSNISLGEMDFENVNPNGPVKLANATAQEWPSIDNKLYEVKIDLGYKFTRNLTAGIRYLYENYDLDDFRWEIMDPYMAGQSAENSTDFVFTDATYSGYEAHVGGIYIAYEF